MIVAHCEDNSLLNGGYIHDGQYAKLHNHKGICSESEWGPIKRDIELSKKQVVIIMCVIYQPKKVLI